MAFYRTHTDVQFLANLTFCYNAAECHIYNKKVLFYT